VQDEQCQLDDPERQRGPRGIGFAPLLKEARGLRDLEEGAGEEEEGEDAREHPAGHDLPLRNRGLRHLHFSGTTWIFCRISAESSSGYPATMPGSCDFQVCPHPGAVGAAELGYGLGMRPWAMSTWYKVVAPGKARRPSRRAALMPAHV